MTNDEKPTRKSKKSKAEINWLVIEENYLKGVTPSALAIKYNMSSDKISNHMNQCGFSEKLRQLREDAPRKVREFVEINSEIILCGILDIATSKTAKDADKLRAYELLGKNLGLFKDQTTIINNNNNSTPYQINVSFSNNTDNRQLNLIQTPDNPVPKLSDKLIEENKKDDDSIIDVDFIETLDEPVDDL